MSGTSTSILPGSWLGVFGGGQLGRMFVHAAQRMGYHVAVLDREENCPAAQAADRHIFELGATRAGEMKAVFEFSEICSAITLEFENVPASWLRIAAEAALVRPCANFLEICQDRIREKTALQVAGFPTTPFRPVETIAEVLSAATELGYPLVLKTAQSGYDGKGQMAVTDEKQIRIAWPLLNTDRAVAEKWIAFHAELSILCARNARGQIETYPLFENEHAHHILDVTRCPIRPEFKNLEPAAAEIARGVAEKFSVEGLFCIEFFVAHDGDLMINEIAPRPHNSGHLTIEAFNCSQFEQQVRAVANLPLARPEQIAPAAMANLLGQLWDSGTPNWESVLQLPETYLHLYGKSCPRSGRKMGHITVLSESSNIISFARQVRERLKS